MEKDFDGWNKKKKELEYTTKSIPLFHEREIWWCSIGHNLGHETCGKNELFERPVLIVKRYGSALFMGAPLTSSNKNDRFHFPLLSTKFTNPNTQEELLSNIMLSHIKSMSSVRLIRRMGKISRSELRKVKTAMRDFI